MKGQTILALLLATLLGHWAERADGISYSIRVPRSIAREQIKSNMGDMTKPANIKSLSVKSLIMSRFATTTVNSQIKNHHAIAREVIFDVQIPESAFIYNFSMVIDGEVYVGNVKPKEEAKAEYTRARERGQSGAIVHQKPRETNRFNVAVNVEPGKKVWFTLDYQELLLRKLGIYEHRISIQPGQTIPEFDIEVNVVEPQGIAFIESPHIEWSSTGRSNNVLDEVLGESIVTVNRDSSNRAQIIFTPSVEQQREFSPDGIIGEFIVRYDVNHEELSAGEIQIFNGYFVHYFAPTSLPVARKNVVFVIDISGSMRGAKIQQTKEAMRTILDDMRSFDKFNIITFSRNVYTWRPQLVPATQENVNLAKEFTDDLSANGGTNFDGGVSMGIDQLTSSANIAEEEESAHLIIVLTDGKPTAGERDLEAIRTKSKEAIRGQYSLFCLGFGNDVDFAFLEGMSYDNKGIARKIYEDSDASLQLKGFYDEVATPLLFDINLNYPNDVIDDNSVTQNTFPIYYNGSEIVVSGSFIDGFDQGTVHFTVVANTGDNEIELEKDISIEESESEYVDRDVANDFLERLWAYLTIKQNLKKADLVTDEDEAARLRLKALEMSLNYNFVSALTSMIVVQPEDPNYDSVLVEVEEIDSVPERPLLQPSAVLLSSFVPRSDPRLGKANSGVPRQNAGTPGSSSNVGRQQIRWKTASRGSQGPFHRPPSKPRNYRPMNVRPTRGPRVPLSTAKYDATTKYDDTTTAMTQTTVEKKSQEGLVMVPVYILNFKNENITACLNVAGNGNEVNLINDTNIGLHVNAKLRRNAFDYDYISDIKVEISENSGQKIGLAANLMSLMVEAQNNMAASFPWDILFGRTGPTRTIARLSNTWTLLYRPEYKQLVLSNGQNISIVIYRETQIDQPRLPRHNLLILFEDKSGFSPEVTGLLGQFIHAQAAISDEQMQERRATLTVNGDRQTGVRYTGYKDPLTNSWAMCWLSQTWLDDLIHGNYSDYLIR